MPKLFSDFTFQSLDFSVTKLFSDWTIDFSVNRVYERAFSEALTLGTS